MEGSYWVGEQSVPWRSTSIALRGSCSDKMKGIFHRSLFGMMFVPSTDTLGVNVLTSFLADFRVKTLAWPVAVQDSRDHALAFGENLRASFAKYDHNTSSWKIAHDSQGRASIPSSGIWPKWGMMRNGECWALTAPEPLIGVNESGSSVTWPTVTVCGNDNRAGLSPTSGDGLATVVRKFPTPPRDDGCGGPGTSGREGGSNLRTDVNGPLNPTWVEWLMGWPQGWTATYPLHSLAEWCNTARNGLLWKTDPADTLDGITRTCLKCENRANRIKALGNGQVPVTMVLAWRCLTEKRGPT